MWAKGRPYKVLRAKLKNQGVGPLVGQWKHKWKSGHKMQSTVGLVSEPNTEISASTLARLTTRWTRPVSAKTPHDHCSNSPLPILVTRSPISP